MKLYLVESIPSDFKFDNGKIIALTPEVCYYLDEKGIDYDIIEDFFDDNGLFENRLSFMEEQSSWFNNFDCFLKDEISYLSEMNLNLATLDSIYLKTYVVDPVIYKSRSLLALLEQFHPDEVIFIKLPESGKKEDKSLFFNDESLLSKLAPIACREKSIRINLLTGTKIIDDHVASNRFKQELTFTVKNISKIITFLFAFLSIRKSDKPLNILQTNLAYNGLETIKQILKKSHNAYLLKDNKIYSFANFSFNILDISKFEYGKTAVTTEEWERTSQNLGSSKLLSWINDRCFLDVTEIVLPKLKYFVTTVCPEILDKYVFFAKFLQEKSIDAIVSPFMQSTSELAAIAAARSSSDTKIFCLEHGDDIFQNVFFRLEELSFSDVVITTNEEHKHYLEVLCKRYDLKTKVRVCKHRLLPLKPLRRKKIQRNKIKQTKSGSYDIIFVPTFFIGDSLRIDCDIHLSPTAYYMFQKRILSHFATKKQYHFIWKGLPAVEPLHNPIPKMISDGKISNVIFESKPFVSYLKYPCRVIFDYPSTGMYESIFAGVPTISLCDTRWKCRSSAIENFRSLLCFFDGIEEAIVRIDQFLDSFSESYVFDCEHIDVELIDIIESEFEDA